MKPISLCIKAGLLMLSFAFSAHAQETDTLPTVQIGANDLASCLIKNSDADKERAMKDFMIAALQDEADKANKASMDLGLSIVMSATDDCGIQMSDLDGPIFAQAAGIYGEYIGEKVMTDALAKIGF